MTDPIEVLLKFAFIAVLYLFLLWVARSALKDLGGRSVEPPHGGTADRAAIFRTGLGNGREGVSAGRLIVQQGGGFEPGQSFVVGSGITIGRAADSGIRIEDTYA